MELPTKSRPDRTTFLDIIDPRQLALLLLARLRAEPAAPSRCMARPAFADSLTLGDRAAFRALIDAELLHALSDRDLGSTYALSFALRHQVTRLDLWAHAVAARRRNHIDLAADLESRAKSPIPEELDDAIAAVNSTRPASDLAIPVFGFSALGVHALLIPFGRCRFFDSYEQMPCPAPAAGLFCEHHTEHGPWWNAVEERPPAGRMHAFYARAANITAYDEETLAALVSDFWTRLAAEGGNERTEDRSLLDAAARSLGFEHYGHTQDCNHKELRRRYLDRAKQLHPDAGGSDEAFAELTHAYRTLTSQVRS